MKQPQTAGSGFPLRRSVSILGVLTLALAACGGLGLARAGVEAYEGALELPTYAWLPAERHPLFRGTDGRNIYPYLMLDNLGRVKRRRTWRTVTLENRYLRVTFLPELGGKIYEVLDKTTGSPVFYVNHVVKPGLIGECGAWTSGGVEWNSGPAGHTVSAMQPVQVVILPRAADGSRAVAIGEVERIYRTHWTVVVTLRPRRAFLEERIRIYNATESVRPYYFWNCAAVPNTPGFRFIYPMTLGTDHSGKTFFTWPMFKGRDLSRAINYQDAASIFAYGCDQDFFGCYADDTDRGVVAFADHHQLVGKKAWTWGHGSYGQMYQRALTDSDGPYNEVQTGPLRTQAEVGRLDPLEAVEWTEWWYPVHGLGGFTYANRDVAVNATPRPDGLRLRLLGTATWRHVQVNVIRGTNTIAGNRSRLSPERPLDLLLDYPAPSKPVEVELRADGQRLARFRVPLELPLREPPRGKEPAGSGPELAQSGWEDYLFARFPEAEKLFGQALAKAPDTVAAWTGLGYLHLDRDPARVGADCLAALAVDPGWGLARFAIAVADQRLHEDSRALDQAWKAALDPATAIPARALVGAVLLRRGDWPAARKALSAPGPWRCDPVCRNRLAVALLKLGADKQAAVEARQNLQVDPLDAFARSVLWQAGERDRGWSPALLLRHQAPAAVDLAAQYEDLGQPGAALKALEDWYFQGLPQTDQEPIPTYWAAYLSSRLGHARAAASYLRAAQAHSVEGVFPFRYETVSVLQWALQTDPRDGKAALYLGHLLFFLGRTAEGRAEWQRAADLGVAPAIAYRALGMAARHLDHDLPRAREYLEKADRAAPGDPIVARDLADVDLALADHQQGQDATRELLTDARHVLVAALDQGERRSDFVALLARAQDRLGDYAETARLLAKVHLVVWEGARELHDLFVEARLGLGRAALAAGRNAAALQEFDRALEYPPNLAVGRLENAREAPIQYLRGEALAALGQRVEAIAAWRRAANEPASSDPAEETARKNARAALERLLRSRE